METRSLMSEDFLMRAVFALLRSAGTITSFLLNQRETQPIHHALKHYETVH
jgi:hypothetical protein